MVYPDSNQYLGGSPPGSWQAILNNVRLSGGDTFTNMASPPPGVPANPSGCLTIPPVGLGVPSLRTEDVTYPQRDGVKHFSDWYDPRIITFAEVWVCNNGCNSGKSARQSVRDITQAWSRACADTELVIYTNDWVPSPGFGQGGFGQGGFGSVPVGDPTLVGPFGIKGRPRVATVEWQDNGVACAKMLLRFDAVDHRMWILDPTGLPGSGTKCVTLNPNTSTVCRTYPRCSGTCYTTSTNTGTGISTAAVSGTECAYPIITLNGPLSNPVVEVQSPVDQILQYNAVIATGDLPVIIDAYAGTATQGGVSKTSLLSGVTRMKLSPGNNVIKMQSYSASDNGTAQVCWRGSVIA